MKPSKKTTENLLKNIGEFGSRVNEDVAQSSVLVEGNELDGFRGWRSFGQSNLIQSLAKNERNYDIVLKQKIYEILVKE